MFVARVSGLDRVSVLPVVQVARNPCPVCEWSEENRINIVFPVEVKGAGRVVPQKRLNKGDVSSGPSRIWQIKTISFQSFQINMYITHECEMMNINIQVAVR